MTGVAGHPTAGSLLTESWAAFWARRSSSLTASFVTALVCLVVLATTGRTAATEAEVLGTIDSLGTRVITVTDSTGSAGIAPSAVDDVNRLDGVEWAFALGPAADATLPGVGATRTGAPVTSRAILGDLPVEAERTGGRAPRPGEAVAGRRAAEELGLVGGVGAAHVGSRPVAVVGTFASTGPLAALDSMVLVRAEEPGATTVRYLYVLAASGYEVEAVADLVAAVLPAASPAAVDVEVAEGALQLRTVLSGALGQASRQLMATVLTVGLLLVALTTTAAANGRRRDFGRQRALGASRSAIAALVILHSTIAGGLGATAGTGTGVLVLLLRSGPLPPWTFSLGLMALSVVVSVAGAVLPALAAARRDPVRILRVP